MARRNERLSRLECSGPQLLSERVKAWLGLRPPLTAAEQAAEPERGPVDLSRLSPALRAWLAPPMGGD